MFLKGGKDRVFNGQKPYRQTFFDEAVNVDMIEFLLKGRLISGKKNHSHQIILKPRSLFKVKFEMLLNPAKQPILCKLL
jgi:hypothetical protein